MSDLALDHLSVEPQPASLPWRHVAAVTAGNALEFYDFLTYVYFSTYIGDAIFPAETASGRLLQSLAGFGVGFLMRPVGAVVLGGMGDRIGRKPAMMLSFSLMGIAIVGLALTPSYASIGLAAPILVVLFRMLQGFALGGEVGPTTAFLIEAAPIERRGFYASMQYTSQDFSGLVAGIIGLALVETLDADQLRDWGWRVALLIGATIIPFGLMLRRSLPETLFKAEDGLDSTAHTAAEPSYRPVVVLGGMMLISGTVGAYVISYMTDYTIDTLAMPASAGFLVLIVSSLSSVIFEPISGWLSDRFGRKPVMIVPGVVLLLSLLPVYWCMSHYRTSASLYLGMIWVAGLSALSTTPVVTTLTESLPKRIRSGTTATVYAISISVFGGTTPFVVKWLLTLTGNDLMPAYYWSGAAIIGLAAMTLVKESSPLHQRAGRQ